MNNIELDTSALENLKNHQQQLDADGCMVGVSRQALDILINYVESRATQPVTGNEVEVCPACNGEGEYKQVTGRIIGRTKTYNCWRCKGKVANAIYDADTRGAIAFVEAEKMAEAAINAINRREK